MIPNIFISSTIVDLHHLRDAIRDTIQELNYVPRMSEYGDLGYLPDISVEDSCYQSIKECQLFILIIGKTYGSLGKNNLGITHNEFKTAKELKAPVICIIDNDVHTYKRVFDANKDTKMTFPNMDQPEMTFGLIQEFASYSENNGYLTYKTMFEARHHIKQQLAHIFCDLLIKRHQSVRGEIRDVLAEITTLRHLLLKDDQEEKASLFVKLTRLLLDEKYKTLKDFAERVVGGIEKFIPAVVKYSDLSSLIKGMNISEKVSVDIEEINIFKGDKLPEKYTTAMWQILPFRTPKESASIGGKPFLDFEYDEKSGRAIFAFGRNIFWCNPNGMHLLTALFEKLKSGLQQSETHSS